MMNLGKIAAVTISTSDLNKMVNAYQESLRYRVTKSGQITAQESSAWGTENLTNADYVVMQPEKSDDFSFRFIHQPDQSNYIAFKSVGWNAAELIVEDVDGLAVQLEDSPFKIIGSPADLSFTKDIRAMQVMGPANEILYLTQFKIKSQNLIAQSRVVLWIRPSLLSWQESLWMKCRVIFTLILSYPKRRL